MEQSAATGTGGILPADLPQTVGTEIDKRRVAPAFAAKAIIPHQQRTAVPTRFLVYRHHVHLLFLLRQLFGNVPDDGNSFIAVLVQRQYDFIRFRNCCFAGFRNGAVYVGISYRTGLERCGKACSTHLTDLNFEAAAQHSFTVQMAKCRSLTLAEIV